MHDAAPEQLRTVRASPPPSTTQVPDPAVLPDPGLMPVPGVRGAAAPIRRHASDDPLGGSHVPGSVASALRRRHGQGAQLPEQIAQPMGQHLGIDTSALRVHSDPEAGHIARSLQATAFTHGDDIYFAPGAYRPGSADGQRVLAHELSHVAAQRSGADRAGPAALTVGRADDPAEAAADRSADAAMAALRRTFASPAPTDHQAPTNRSDVASADLRRVPLPLRRDDSTTETYPRTVSLGGEKVVLEKEEDQAEATGIVQNLKDNYGIELSSAKTITGIKNEYTRVKKSVTDRLGAAAWTMDELRALNEAAGYYAPILGGNRAKSTLAKKSQGVTSVGKLKNAINKDSSKGKLDTSTLGEYFSSEKNIGMFSAGTDYEDDSFVRPGEKDTDVRTSLTATAIHEMAHGLVEPLQLKNWVKKLDYWQDVYTASGAKGAEKPPTEYGEDSAAEDLCESVAMFFINRDDLKAKCPEREKFIARVVRGWTPKEKAEVVQTAVQAKGTESPPPLPSREGRPALSTSPPPVPSREGRPALSTSPPPVPSREGRPKLAPVT